MPYLSTYSSLPTYQDCGQYLLGCAQSDGQFRQQNPRIFHISLSPRLILDCNDMLDSEAVIIH